MMSSAGGWSAASVARMSSTLVSAASFTGAWVERQAFGAQPDLRHCLLAGDIDDRLAGSGERAGHLKQQGRLADAGIAADQQGRAAHEAAAGDPVELGDAGADARRIVDLTGKRGERHRPALAELAGRGAGRDAAAGLSSTSVFHPPQSSHLPCQRGETAPQFWQTKLVFRRTTDERATRGLPVLAFLLCSHGLVPLAMGAEPAAGRGCSLRGGNLSEERDMAEQPMGIYRLVPKAAPQDSGWDLAPDQVEIVVRAHSPADARVVAAEAEGDFPEFDAKPAHGVRTAPASAFRDIRLYAVVEEKNDRFDANGPRGIIDGRPDPAVLRPAKQRRA